ncbi:hypothetical protein [Simkania sp.]|uniref:hypothetical protein n=1 Tax=Simkania sp. TaxID=34094 RepID=UPI003B518867
MTIGKKYLNAEMKLSKTLRDFSPYLLFWVYGVIYFWYGLLKIFGISPVEELVQKATQWIFAHEFVIMLGLWECLLGLFLFIPRLRRIGLLLLFLQFPGTFMPLFTNPEDCFTVFPFGLTLEGQYILKNLILICGGLVMVGALHGKSSGL